MAVALRQQGSRFKAFPREVWLLLILTVAVFTSIGVSALVLNLYLVALGYREDFLGTVSFASTIALSGAALPASGISNRIGARNCLMIGTALLAVTTAAVAFATRPLPIVFILVANGIGQALIFVPSAPYLMQFTSTSERPRAFGANYAAMSLGSVVGSALGGLLPSLNATANGPDLGGYRSALLLSAALTGLAIVTMIGRHHASRSRLTDRGEIGPAGTKDPGATGEVISAPPRLFREIGGMALATVLLNASTAIMTVFFNVYLLDRTGASVGAIGFVYAIAAAVVIPASLLGPILAGRFGPVRTIVTARLLAAPAVLLPALIGSFSGGSGAFILRASLVGLVQPVDSAFIMGRVPVSLHARVSAIRNMSLDVSWAITSVIAGVIVVRWGYPPIFAIGACCLLASAIVYRLAFREAAKSR